MVVVAPVAEMLLPSNTSVFRLNAGNLTTSSYVTRSSWSKTALCLARYLSFFFLANHEQFTAQEQQETEKVSVSNNQEAQKEKKQQQKTSNNCLSRPPPCPPHKQFKSVFSHKNESYGLRLKKQTWKCQKLQTYDLWGDVICDWNDLFFFFFTWYARSQNIGYGLGLGQWLL